MNNKEIFATVWTKEGKRELTKREWLFFNKRLLHREDGPAVEWTDGTTWWCLNGKKHRLDGPALDFAVGEKWWCVDGKMHRLDGPAAEFSDGLEWWFVNNKQIPNEEIEQWLYDNNIDLQTEEGQLAFKLRFS